MRAIFCEIVVDQGLEFGGDGYTEYAESVVSHKPKVRGGVLALSCQNWCCDSPFRLVRCCQHMCGFSLRMELVRFLCRDV